MGLINRKVNTNTRMRNQHPFDVWRVLFAMKMRATILGEDDPFYSPEEIANVLFVNFSGLSSSEQERVVRLKLALPLACLSTSCFIEQLRTTELVPDRYLGPAYGTVKETFHKQYRARPLVYNIKGISRATGLDWTRSSIDDAWGKWIGRRQYTG